MVTLVAVPALLAEPAGLTALAADLDDYALDASGTLTTIVKVLIAIFLFGVALDTTPSDFREVLRRPWVIVVCLVAQYAVVPALTLLLLLTIDVHPSVALGMLFVVCCPSGNLSNLLTHRAHGDVSLSVSLTTVSTVVAILATPAAFAFWGSLQPKVAGLLRDIALDPADMAVEVGLLIAAPFAAGIVVAQRWPRFAERARGPVETGTLVLLVLFIVGALAGRLSVFVATIGAVVVGVVVQNLGSLLLGYGIGRAGRLPAPAVRALTFELGLRNTGLALVLVIAFFGSLGGAVLVVAFWGLWDVITGLTLATWWKRRGQERGARGRRLEANP